MFFFLLIWCLLVVKNQVKTMRIAKPNARNILASNLRNLACELHTSANEMEKFGELSKVENLLKNSPELVKTLRHAAWELHERRFEKALEILATLQDVVAEEKVAEAQV